MERDFVKDLEYLRDFWLKPLRALATSAAHAWIPKPRREKCVRTVFSNCTKVHSVNSTLAEALTRRQQDNRSCTTWVISKVATVGSTSKAIHFCHGYQVHMQTDSNRVIL